MKTQVPQVFLGGKRVRISASAAIGKGGEADVFGLGGGIALKLFKRPEHPDLAHSPDEQAAARARLDMHQDKLPAFPRGLPARVVAPLELARDRAGRVAGYTMPLIDHAEVLYQLSTPAFRKSGGDPQLAVATLRELHATLGQVHDAGVVIGDFNDLNVLVRDGEAWLIDADSFQYGRWPCVVFTERFVDPRLCNPAGAGLELARPFDAASDWYAFAVMVMRTLLLAGPYDGVHRPSDPGRRVAAPRRPLHRVTLFDPEVVYPRPALPMRVLPDDLVGHLRSVFVDDLRAPFPVSLLDDLRWTRCTGCGAEHARAVCPSCSAGAAAPVRTLVQVRGQVRATRLFETRGRLLAAAVCDGVLCCLEHVALPGGDVVRREDGRVLLRGRPDPRVVFALQAKATVVGRGGQLAVLGAEGQGAPDSSRRVELVDTVDGRPAFAVNARHRYQVQGGALMRDGEHGPFRIGSVLSGQTRIWVGAEFGLGFYRAGELTVGFVFEADRAGVDDRVALPTIPGQLVEARCVFGRDLAWLRLTVQHRGQLHRRMLLVTRGGLVVASAEAPVLGSAGALQWLAAGGGMCAAGAQLFVATDQGVVRVEQDGPGLVQTRSFVDTSPFVHAGHELLAGPDGLLVVGEHDVYGLSM